MIQHLSSLWRWTIILTIVFSGKAIALSSDREQPVKIEADRLDVDDVQGISTYRGNVIVTQGSLTLKADVIVIRTTKRRALNRIEASGNPALFSQLMDETGAQLRGQAQRIEYDVSDEYVLFNGLAHFWHCGDEFSGNRVEYFAKQELVKASKATSGEERVHVVLQPRPENSDQGERPCDTTQDPP